MTHFMIQTKSVAAKMIASAVSTVATTGKMKKLLVFFGGLAVALCMSQHVLANIITFDDLPGAIDAIPNGYGGLNWDNFYYLDGINYAGNPSGYLNGVVSANNVAFNGYGGTAAISNSPFTFESAYFTAAWNDGLSITATGYLLGSPVYQTTFVVDTYGPTLETFNWSNIDMVHFESFGGVDHGYVGGGEHFAMDNFTYTIPEPSALALLGVGVIGPLGYVWRRRRAK